MEQWWRIITQHQVEEERHAQAGNYDAAHEVSHRLPHRQLIN